MCDEANARTKKRCWRLPLHLYRQVSLFLIKKALRGLETLFSRQRLSVPLLLEVTTFTSAASHCLVVPGRQLAELRAR